MTRVWGGQAAYMNGGREPSEEEMADQRQEAEKEFDSLDKDADGKLTLEEVPSRFENMTKFVRERAPIPICEVVEATFGSCQDA